MKSPIQNTVTVILVLAVAFGVLLLIVNPTTVGRLSVALLAPIVAWLVLPGGKGRVGDCPGCGAPPKKQSEVDRQVKVEPGSIAGAAGGSVSVQHGWNVTTTKVTSCAKCQASSSMTQVRFVDNRVAATPAEALLQATGKQKQPRQLRLWRQKRDS